MSGTWCATGGDRIAPPARSGELPLSQATMQELHLLSTFTLQKVWGFRLWRLHEDIPFKLVCPMAKPHTKPPDKKAKVEEEEEEDMQPEEGQEVDPEAQVEDGVVQRGPVRYISTNSSLKWSVQELSFIPLTTALTHKKAYLAYMCVVLCRT